MSIVDSTTDNPNKQQSATLRDHSEGESSSDETVRGISLPAPVSDSSPLGSLTNTGQKECLANKSPSASRPQLVNPKIEANDESSEKLEVEGPHRKKSCKSATHSNSDSNPSKEDGNPKLFSSTETVSIELTAGKTECGTSGVPFSDGATLKLESLPNDKKRRCNSSYIFDVDDPSKNGVLCIDLLESSDDERDVKPLFTPGVEYSTSDEVIILDSDDEDFPCSQLNATHVDDVPDFSPLFESMFDEAHLDNSNTSVNLSCTEDTWFESLSQSNLQSTKKLIVDLPMLDYKARLQKSDVEVCGDATPSSSFATDSLIDLSEERNLYKKENTSVRSPKRRINEDDVDTAAKPLKKKNSFGSPKERNSEEFTTIPFNETLIKKVTQPCWVVLPWVDGSGQKKRKTMVSAQNYEANSDRYWQ
jgi:hypothetical protein